MLVTDSKGVKWQLNEERVNGLINRHAFNYAFKAYSKVVRTKDHWLQALKLAPDHREVATDWPAMEAYKEDVAKHNRKVFNQALANDVARAFGYLAYWLQEVRQLECDRNTLFSNANSINTANQEWAGHAVKWAERTRDTSFTAIGVIATVATGGTTFYIATLASATGSGLSTYQDGRKAGQSVSEARLKAFGAAGLTVIPIGVGRLTAAASTAKGAIALTVVVDGSVEFAKAKAIEGDNLDVAASKALATVAFSGAAAAIKGPAVNWLGRNLKGVGAVLDKSADGVRLHNRTPPLVTGLASSQIRTIAMAEYGPGSGPGSTTSRPLLVHSSSGVPANVCVPVSPEQLSRMVSSQYMRRLN